jgi:hypothetical protein
MRPLSAIDAIGPAFGRTKDVLARPFRLRTFLKIAAVAFFAEMGGFNFNFGRGSSNGLHQLPPAFLAFVVAFAVLIGFLALVIGLILFYIGSRLQLVLLELVATRYTLISPLWSKYGSRTWRWIGLRLLLMLFMLLLLMPFIIMAVVYVFHHAHGPGVLGVADLFSGLHIAQILLFILAALVVVLVVCAIYMLVHDLALPFLALEDLSISESLGRLRALIAAEPGQVILYVVLRFVLGLVFAIVAEIAIFLVLLISLIPAGIVGVILWFSLHHAGTAGIVVLVACAIFGGLAYLCWAVCVVIAFMGSLLTFFQAYALYFLGGRYPILGDLLDRSTPPPAYAYPVAFPPPYQPPPPEPPSFPPAA